ncbi:hypothetical protein B0A55_08735 [Friedmanniomyces simplex]|uniref:F-box domain-containing protein n=1 Tax=Friedmanniomyces simplex TaxID=329884 RepID=A0A4U0WM79_9PEZI|nr:hypothetical protein B0A55_08735 [Friedmanniomyces simplex]
MTSRLLDLPYELRHIILSLALKDKGTVELQHPVWGGEDVYRPALFGVCHSLRRESLQAFYEVNHFLWIIDLSAQHRSDPADYPALRPGDEAEDHEPGSTKQGETTILPALPWEYPHLRKHLRHLNVNIYLPSNLIADVASAQVWFGQFPSALERLVTALDCGRRLDELQILFTAKRFNTRIALAGEQLKAIEVLSGFKVRGRVRVQTRWDFKEARRSLENLDLERRMKA